MESSIPHKRKRESALNPLFVLPSPFSGGLLRKEVIQPHLPVRLPCYDFTPLTRRTFDGSLPYGLSLRLRVPPTRVV